MCMLCALQIGANGCDDSVDVWWQCLAMCFVIVNIANLHEGVDMSVNVVGNDKRL